MTQIIDRRQSSRKKSTVNRQRFVRRYKKQIKQAVSDAVSKRSITDIDKGEAVNIPKKDITEYNFGFGKGGHQERVLPGNDRFIAGDHIERAKTGSGEGSEASNQGEGEDDFVFQLTREEFLDIYFDDLELPDLVKKELAKVNSEKRIRAGVTKSGSASSLNVVRSMREAMARRIAHAGPYKRQLRELEEELYLLQNSNSPNKAEGEKLLQQMEELKKKISKVPYLDTLDIRYNNLIKVTQPTTQAVMFCIMDVSGSMDEAKKDMSKRFFILLYLFLTKTYGKTEIVFIRHHTSAKEVNEHDFFYSRETGGTVVSSSLELLNKIIEERFSPKAWNIYVAQASDGDNWNADSPKCLQWLKEKIMPLIQYYAYVEVMPRHHQSLWDVYLEVQKEFGNFAMKNIDKQADIYPVFRDLFKRKMV